MRLFSPLTATRCEPFTYLILLKTMFFLFLNQSSAEMWRAVFVDSAILYNFYVTSEGWLAASSGRIIDQSDTSCCFQNNTLYMTASTTMKQSFTFFFLKLISSQWRNTGPFSGAKSCLTGCTLGWMTHPTPESLSVGHTRPLGSFAHRGEAAFSSHSLCVA